MNGIEYVLTLACMRVYTLPALPVQLRGEQLAGKMNAAFYSA